MTKLWSAKNHVSGALKYIMCRLKISDLNNFFFYGFCNAEGDASRSEGTSIYKS